MTPGRVIAAVTALAPTTLAAAFVLVGFVSNAVPLDQLWRPLVVAVGVALAAQLIAVLALGPTRGSFWAFVAVCLLSGLFVLAGASVLALTLFGLVSPSPERQYRLGALLTLAVSAVLLTVLVVQGASRGAFDWSPIPVAARDTGPLTAGPSIHLLMLDGYPRADLLAEIGFDNGAFLAALQERGFDHYPASQSNYDRTPFSLLTMLSMRHFDEIDELDRYRGEGGGVVEQERIAGRALLDVSLFDALTEAGYRTRLVEAPVVYVPLGGADSVIDAGAATNFELDTLQRTPLAGLLELFGFAMGQGRAHVTGTIGLFAEPPESPSFTIAHVMAPHAPFSFGADGSAAPAPPCYPATCAIFDGRVERLGWSADEHWARLVAHLEHLNALMLDAVDHLIAEDPDAVIVLLSDHGQLVDGEPANMFRNLLLARTPGHPELFGDAPTLVNVMPALLNAYLGADLAPLPDNLFRSSDDPWLEVTPYR